MLAKSRAEKRQVREPKITDSGEAFMPDDQSLSETNSTWGVVNVDATEDGNPTEDLRMPSSKSPWAICKYWNLFYSQSIHRRFFSIRERRFNNHMHYPVSRTI